MAQSIAHSSRNLKYQTHCLLKKKCLYFCTVNVGTRLKRSAPLSTSTAQHLVFCPQKQLKSSVAEPEPSLAGSGMFKTRSQILLQISVYKEIFKMSSKISTCLQIQEKRIYSNPNCEHAGTAPSSWCFWI